MRKLCCLLLLLTVLTLTACVGNNAAILTGDDIDDEQGSAGAGESDQLPLEYSDSLQDEQGETYATVAMSVPGEIYDALPDEAAGVVADDLLAFAAEQSQAWMEDQAAMHEADGSLESDFTIDFTLFYEDDQIISVIAEGYDYVSGAAHPNIYAYGFVYDAVSGERITIDRILGSDWRDQLFPAIYQQIEAGGDLPAYFQPLDTLLADAFREDGWYADGENVYVVYNTAEIAPYVIGTPTFSLPR